MNQKRKKSAIRLIVLLSDQNLMKNFRKIGSSFLDRLCGIWSPIPLEVRSCALRQSISTPPWQQQCSPNDCTMGSKLVYWVKIILLSQTMEILKELRTTTHSLLWKIKTILIQKSQTWQIINFLGWMIQCTDIWILNLVCPWKYEKQEPSKVGYVSKISAFCLACPKEPFHEK